LSGDPSGFFSAVHGCGPVPNGSGTTFLDNGSCVSGYAFGRFGSGLGRTDSLYSWAPGNHPAEPNGCYWFGGYSSANPSSSFWMVVYGERCSDEIGTSFCTSNPNSVGPGAEIVFEGSNLVSEANATLCADPVPNQPGLFFHAAMPLSNPFTFGCGYLCAGGGVARGVLVMGNGNKATYQYDNSSPKRSLANYTGRTRHFQYWYRDPMYAQACGSVYNTSNAISVPILP
jgi:hypothetical protein